MRRRLRWVALGVVTATAVASCGGDGTPRSTHAELVAQADAVCSRGRREADELRGRSDPNARGAAAAAEVDATIEVLNRQVDAFDEMRGPASTDAALETAVRQLRIAARTLEDLRDRIEEQSLTVNDGLRANTDLVEKINLASARANDALLDLGFLSCIGFDTSG